MRVGIPTPSRTLVALPALLLVFGACGDDTTVVGGPAGSDDSSGVSLDGRQFWSVSVLENGVERPLVEDTRVSVRFNNGKLSASAGCNSMGGPYQIDDNQRLTVSETATTEIGCDPQRHAQDEFVAAVLTDHPRLTLSGDLLILATDTVRIEFLDTEVADPDRPILATRWAVTGFIQGEVHVSMNVDPAQEGWIEFSEDSQLTGFDGCVDFSSPAEVSDGSTGGPVEGDGEIQFGAITSAVCEEPSRYSEAFAALFETGDAVFSIDGPRLTLLDSDGNGATFHTDE